MNNEEYRSQIGKGEESMDKGQNLLTNGGNNSVGVAEQAKEQVRAGILGNLNNGVKELEGRQGNKDVQKMLAKKEEALLKRKKLLLQIHKKQGLQPEIERINQELDKVEIDLSKNNEIQYTLMAKKVELSKMKNLLLFKKQKMKSVDIERINQKVNEIDSDISDINLCYLGRGNKEGVLRDIRDNYVKIKKCRKMRMGYISDYSYPNFELVRYDPLYKTLHYEYVRFYGADLYVDLPRIGSFEGYKTEIFIPYFSTEQNQTLADIKLIESSKAKLAEALRRYLLEFGIEIDKGVSYIDSSDFISNRLNYSTEGVRFIQSLIHDIETHCIDAYLLGEVIGE